MRALQHQRHRSGRSGQIGALQLKRRIAAPNPYVGLIVGVQVIGVEINWPGLRGLAVIADRKSFRFAVAASDTVKYSGPACAPAGTW